MKKIITLTFIALPFIALAQLQNMNFEQWKSDPNSTPEWIQNKPDGWILRNDLFESEEATFYYPAETSAQDGDYALKLGIWYNYAKDEAKQKAPINYRPAELTGYYKYTDNELLAANNEIIKDTARVSVYLTKWNEVLSKNDTIGFGRTDLSESIAYNSFTCTINYTSNEIPDNIIVLLDCSKLKRNIETEAFICLNNTGSYFTVDNLKLTENTMGTEDFTPATTIKLYPNPAKDVVTITNFSGDASVYDTTGKLVLTHSNTANSPLNVQQLQKGVYALKLSEGGTVTYLKLIKD